MNIELFDEKCTVYRRYRKDTGFHNFKMCSYCNKEKDSFEAYDAAEEQVRRSIGSNLCTYFYYQKCSSDSSLDSA